MLNSYGGGPGGTSGGTSNLLGFLNSYGGGPVGTPVPQPGQPGAQGGNPFFQDGDLTRLGRTGASVLGGVLERRRAKKALEAGLKARETAAREQFNMGRMAANKMEKKLRNRGKATQESLDAIQNQKKIAEELLKANERGVQERRADLVSAAQYGDPRGTSRIEDILEGDSSDLQARLEALQVKGKADQALADLAEDEKTFQSVLDKEAMTRGLAAADEGRNLLLDLNERSMGVNPAATAAGTQFGTALSQFLYNPQAYNPGEGNVSYGTVENGARLEKGGYMASEGFVTEGEFSHATNKKAVIDEENGVKEAELTGGEVVFNPQQVAGMDKHIANNDEKGLFKYMKNLLSKPQFKKDRGGKKRR